MTGYLYAQGAAVVGMPQQPEAYPCVWGLTEVPGRLCVGREILNTSSPHPWTQHPCWMWRKKQRSPYSGHSKDTMEAHDHPTQAASSAKTPQCSWHTLRQPCCVWPENGWGAGG